MKYVEWVEPGEDGVTPVLQRITAEEAIRHVKRCHIADLRTELLTDEQLLEDFLVVYWATLKEE